VGWPEQLILSRWFLILQCRFSDLEWTPTFAIINSVPHGSALKLFPGWHSRDNQREANG
jgi:hypothetical protein